MVVKFTWPPPPPLSLHIGELRCQAIQIEHGPYIAERTQKAVYIAERTQNAVYIVRCHFKLNLLILAVQSVHLHQALLLND
jgi:hypothetical protein